MKRAGNRLVGLFGRPTSTLAAPVGQSGAMDAPVPLWIVRLAWLVLPFLAWAGVGAALDGASSGASIVVAAIAWAVWAVVLVATAMVRPVALVILRLLVPLAPAATATALLLAAGEGSLAAGDGDTITALLGFAAGVVAAVAVMLPSTGDYFLNGDSYGDEQRFGLRCPGALVVTLGPLWLLGVALPAAGIAWLAGAQWAMGAAALIVGGLAGVWLWAVAGRLAQRFVVFVPAGLTVVDPLSLAEPVLFARNRTLSIGPAFVDPDPSDADVEGERVDLSGAALGLAIELRTDGPTEVVTLSRPSERDTSDGGGLADRMKAARMGVSRQAASVLFTPSRPAEFLLQTRRANSARA